MSPESLTGMVLEYQRSGDGLPAIIEELAVRIYRYPLRHRSHDEDDCGEFYLFFYPRLLRCLARFRNQGKPFEWYLNAVLRWHWQAYCRRRRSERAGWFLAGKREFWESAAEPTAEESDPLAEANFSPFWRAQAGSLGLALESRQSGRADRRRLLLVALKNVQALPDESLGPLSLLIDVPEAWLAATVDRLRQRLFARQVRLHALYARRNRTFSALLREQQALLWESEAERRAGQLLRVEALRRRLRRTQGELRRAGQRPTNREIADLTCIPKGSVDTSIYWLRRRLCARQAAAGAQTTGGAPTATGAQTPGGLGTGSAASGVRRAPPSALRLSA